MTHSRILTFGATVLLLTLAFGLTSEISAQTLDMGDEDGFEVGGSCAGLAYLGTVDLKSFISSGYSDDFHSFCFPEEPSECSDYNGFLRGLGHLTTGEDGYHCSLQLQM